MSKESFQKLLDLTKQLRDPKSGCPWDIKQTIETLQECMREESEEVFEAIRNNDMENLKEELGDLFFNVIIMAYVAEQDGKFTLKEVIDGIVDKIIRRHPHVFGDAKADSPEEALANWNKVKEEEKKKD